MAPMGLIVLDHEELARRTRGLRDGGKRVVFTNGCFDLLHVGHVRCLLDAATRGDFLIVALNSDDSIRKLKGTDRPVQPEAERAEIVAAIQGVSYVTVFAEPTVGPLLRKLRPQIVAKGTDYDADNLPEKEVVAEIGAELVIVGDPKKHSTVKLLDRIRGRPAARGKEGAAKPGKGRAKAPAKTAKPAARKPAKAPRAMLERVKRARGMSEAHA
jgi:rfaE bifunctional protein nucleotidyltransferase chain/domain